MPTIQSIIAAVERLDDWTSVNHGQPLRKQVRAMRTLNHSIGLTNETVDFIAWLMSSSELPEGLSAEEAAALVMFGITVALSAVELERDEVDLSAAA
jgi:hypothetical protein